jgi:hypothetical protein
MKKIIFFFFFFFKADGDIAFIFEVETIFEKNLKGLPINDITKKINSGEIKKFFKDTV